MNAQLNQAYFTGEEYLELERQSSFRHEFQRGLMYAMASTPKNHSRITLNLSVLIGNYLHDSIYEIYSINLKIRIKEVDCYYYPDISITCDKEDLEENNDFIVAPKLIIEVLSKSTERFDRTENFLDYQQLPSLEEYVLVNQYKTQVECYRKQKAGEWLVQVYNAEEIVEFRCIDFKCPIEKIYHKILGLIS